MAFLTRRRVTVVAAWALSLVLAVAVGWWAAVQATTPPQVRAPTTQVITTAAMAGTVSVTQSYGIDVVWPTRPVGFNGATGTLTSLAVKARGSQVTAGDTLYTVDLAPVLAVQGSVPAFRELAVGVRGADVRQLERFLVAKNYLRVSPDSYFTRTTAVAVDRWWKKLGLDQNGRVPLGRVMFVPSMPATLAPASDLRVGMSVSRGQSMLVAASSAPEFSFRVLPEAVARTTPGMTVSIDAKGEVWYAKVDRLAASTGDNEGTMAVLRPRSGTSICARQCAKVIPLGRKTILPGSLVLVPQTRGTQVPTAAIRTDAAGGTCVVLGDNTVRAVTVKATSDDGRSIVDGVDVGQRVMVSGQGARC